MREKAHISSTILMDLHHLFEQKGWEIDDSNDNPNSLFLKFGKLLSHLDVEERKLIYELTKNQFNKIELAEYPNIIVRLLKKLQTRKKYIKNVYVVPLTNKHDINKIKSSSLVSYLFKSVYLSYIQLDFNIKVIDSLNELNAFESKINNNPNAILLIVDDFVGTGDSAECCLEYVNNYSDIKSEKIIITSIAAQEEGMNKIKNLGYKCLVYFKLNKGISDNYVGEKKGKYISLMSKIEEDLNVNENNKLGFKQSEAMVSLVRTPNNTFPIFWFDKSYHPFAAPFPRKN